MLCMVQFNSNWKSCLNCKELLALNGLGLVQPWLDLALSLGRGAGQWAEQSQAPAQPQAGRHQVGPDKQVAEGRQEAGGDVSYVSSSVILTPHVTLSHTVTWSRDLETRIHHQLCQCFIPQTFVLDPHEFFVKYIVLLNFIFEEFNFVLLCIFRRCSP